MIEHGVLIEVGILGIMCLVAEHLTEFEHIVGVAAFGTVEIVDVAVAVGGREEVFRHAVTAYTYGTVLCHICPEVIGCSGKGSGSGIILMDTFKTDVFGHLCIGVLIIQESGVEGLHTINHGLVTVLLGCREILGIAEKRIGIRHTLVHAAMFGSEQTLHIGVAHLAYHIHAPVCQLTEHLLGCGIAGIYISIAQTCQYLMFTIEGHPPTDVLEG